MQELIERYVLDLEALGKRPVTRQAYASDAHGLWRCLEHTRLLLPQLGRAEMRA